VSRHGRRGRHPHSGQAVRPRPAAPAQDRNGNGRDPAPRTDGYRPPSDARVAPEPPTALAGSAAPVEPAPALAARARIEPPPEPRPEVHAPAPRPESGPPPHVQTVHPGGDDGRPTCTAAQLRRFIKSRPWIPMHELRRRFGIYGGDDDVTPVRVNGTTLFIGLPAAEGRLMAELLGGGDVGYELSLDPGAPIVVGVYPMRPVARG
jgi:hypothetical protein